MTTFLAISGAQGVGKTTFCNDLSAALKDVAGVSVEMRARVARDLKDRGISSDERTSASDYAPYFERHIENLLKDSVSDYVLLDRSIVDTLAYARVNGNLEPSWMRLSYRLAQLLSGRIRWYFFVPIEFGIEDDGVRYVSSEYQRRLQDEMLSVLGGIFPHFVTVRGSREERISQALQAMGTGAR